MRCENVQFHDLELPKLKTSKEVDLLEKFVIENYPLNDDIQTKLLNFYTIIKINEYYAANT